MEREVGSYQLRSILVTHTLFLSVPLPLSFQKGAGEDVEQD